MSALSPFVVLDWQSCCKDCDSLYLCRWEHGRVRDAALEGAELCRMHEGKEPPIRGFLPVCTVRDKRRAE